VIGGLLRVPVVRDGCVSDNHTKKGEKENRKKTKK